MPRRGLVAKKNKFNRAINSMIEPLENRRLLTTWTGGGVTAAGNPIYNIFTYTQPNSTVVHVQVGGNTTVEAIFFNGTTIDPTATNGYLFQLYVARSDINSVITVTPIDTSGIAPFSTTAPSLVINPNAGIAGENPPTAAGPAGSGAAVLGGLAGAGPFTAVVKENINGIGIGVRPAGIDDLPDDPNNDLSAGLVVAGDQSLGKFLFGGEVFGEVHVPGNMNLFYAGWLLTGDARGATEGSDRSSDGGPISLEDRLEIPRGNFYVGGDLQNLATTGPIGWDGLYGTPSANQEDPHFLSGVDIEIGGKLGSIDALDGDAASVHVLNNGLVPEPVETQEELEGINHGGDFSTGVLTQHTTGADISPFVNNDFLHAQFLGAFDSPLGTNTIQLQGTYDTITDPNTDPDDYYGIGLMAGQTITIQIQGDSGVQFGVFDPNGILVATNYDKLNPANTGNPLQITASTAGEYRIAVSATGDVQFDNFAETDFRLNEESTYLLSVTNLGNLAVGGIVTQGTSLETNSGWQKLNVDNGDVGGIYAATNFHVTAEAEVLLVNTIPNPRLPAPQSIGLPGIEVADGDLRSFVGGAIGLGLDSTGFSSVVFSAPDLDVPNGSVGLVQALTGILELNPNNLADVSEISTISGAVISAPLYGLSIGGNYEVIQGAPSTAENMIVGLVANGGIGIINGPNLQGTPSIIIADADSKGNDGTIDSIDIQGNLENAFIWHGPGGDVRFIRVNGQILDNESYAQGQGQRVVYDYNQVVNLTDDSGSTISLTPLGTKVPNPVFNSTVTDPTNIASVEAFGPRLTIRTYPIASGGVVLVDVASTGGLQVVASGNGTNGRAEISRIEVSGSALAPVETFNASTGAFSVSLSATPVISTTLPVTAVTGPTTPGGTPTVVTANVEFATTQATNVLISGSAITDVANIVVLGPSPLGPLDFPMTPVNPITALGNATQISNSTGGDIMSVAALSVGDLTAKGNIGLAHTSIPGLAFRFNTVFTVGTALPGARSETEGDAPAGFTANEMPVNPISISPSPAGGTAAGNSYPFDNQTYGIAVGGDIVEISAGQGVGNIIADGIIGQVIANASRNSTPGVFAGVAGPIWAFGAVGELLSVNIGQGVLPSGSGDPSFAGLYADTLIGYITGSNADIRGDIITGGLLLGINLNNGALINTEVMTLAVGTTTVGGFTGANWLAARENQPFGFAVPKSLQSSVKPTFEFQGINITGNGGIFGSYLLSNNMGNVNVDGFGIFDSTISAPFDGRIGSITAAGYGLRTDIIGQGATIGSINVTGNGSNLPVTSVTPSVRQSETQPINQYFNAAFDPFSGLELTPENDINATLGTSIATPIIQGVTDTGVIEDCEITGGTALGSLTAQTIRASQVGNTSDPSDPNSPASVNFPMQITIGNSIGSIVTRGIINGLRLVAGTIKKFAPGSDVLALNMSTSGKIKNLQIKGSLAGDSIINAAGTNGGINKISIAHDLVGSIHVSNNVSSISIGGNLSGNLQIDGLHKGLALGKLKVGGALLTGSLNVTGNVGTIQTAGGLGSAGSTLSLSGSLQKLLVGHGNLDANLIVGGKAGTIQVNGAINGAITIGTLNNDLSSLIVYGPVNGAILVNGTLQNAKISGGGVNASIDGVNGIGNFSIINGSLAVNQTIQSSLGSISSLKITGGDLFGSVKAPTGTLKSIVVSNNLGDGIDALTISAEALNLLDVGGSILSGVKVSISGPIGTLAVAGSIEAGSTITAPSLKSIKVGGTIAPGVLHIG